MDRQSPSTAGKARTCARELFGWIDLNVESNGCEGPLAPAVDEYYATLSVLARGAFPAERRDEALNFLQLYLWRAQLPSEMPAVALAIKNFNPSRDEAALLETAYDAIVDSPRRDPRGFSNAALDIVLRTLELEDAHRALDLRGWYLTRSLRKYRLGQFSGGRCGDSIAASTVRDTFNDAIRRRGAIDDDVVEIREGDARPLRMLPAAAIDMYWKNLEAARLRSAYLQLRGTGRTAIPEAERRQPAWRDRADRLVFDLNQWSRGHEPERDFFDQKAVLFSELVELMPRTDARAKARRVYIEFLRRADPPREQRSLWFWFVKRLIEGARDADRGEILSSLENSHHPVLATYARLERIFGSGNLGIWESGN